MDLSELGTDQLQELISRAAAEIERRRKMDRKAALRELEEAAESRGFSLAELFPASATSRGKIAMVRPAKFRHPEDSGKTWNGKGRKPRWLQDWLAQGRPLEELLIK